MLSLIQSGTCKIRTVVKDGVQLFAAADLAEPLGIKNIRDKTKLLDEDEKTVDIFDTPGGPRKLVVLTEPGLLNLILSCPKSRKKGTGAWHYRRWVTHEVLPQIHQTGAYQLQVERLTARVDVLENERDTLMADRDTLMADRANLRVQNQFLEENRLYHIAWTVIPNTYENYVSVRDTFREKPHMLVWKNRTPYVKPAFKGYVIQHIRSL